MKVLKCILFLIYPVLILLLLLGMRGCKGDNILDHSRDSITTEPVDTSVVERAQRTGKSGNLKVTLLWSFWGDIDLHVKQPNGKEIYYQNPTDDSTGGYLDIDNQDGGRGSAENVYWQNPPKGDYKISLVYYQASRTTGIVGSGVCTVVVFQQGKAPQKYFVNMDRVMEKENVVTITVR